MKSLGGEYYTEAELQSLGFRSLGKDVKVHSRASLYGIENISLGNHVRIDDFVVIIATGDLDIGNHVSIHNFCFLGAKYGLILQDFVTLAPGVKIFTASDDYSGEMLTGPTLLQKFTGGKRGKVILEKHVIIGSGTVILPGCKIGEGCSIGALSLVKTDLISWGIYGGIPVSRLKERKKDLLLLENQVSNAKN